MKKVLFWLALVCLSLFAYNMTYAQSADDVLSAILTDSGSTATSWWYLPADKDKIKIISFSGKVLSLEAPVAQKDATTITNYYIAWGPMSYKEITMTNSSEDLQKIQDSDSYQKANNASVYQIVDGKLIVNLPINYDSGDVYITIAPLDPTGAQGNMIEDYTTNLSSQSAGSQVLAENFSSAGSNDAIANVSCLWASDKDRITLSWSVNTAMNASKVEIYHKQWVGQGAMDIKGTPSVGEKTFTMNTSDRKEQLFRLKPVDSNGTMVGNEVMYICKASEVLSSASDDGTSPNGGTVPGIAVVPATWPRETFAFIVFASALLYVVYKKFRKA